MSDIDVVVTENRIDVDVTTSVNSSIVTPNIIDVVATTSEVSVSAEVNSVDVVVEPQTISVVVGDVPAHETTFNHVPDTGSFASSMFGTTDGKQYVRQNGVWVEVTIPSGGGTWGSITGTLSDQTDLQDALNAKADSDVVTTHESTYDHSLLHSHANKTNLDDYDPALFDIAGAASGAIISHVGQEDPHTQYYKSGDGASLSSLVISGTYPSLTIKGVNGSTYNIYIDADGNIGTELV